MMTALHSGVLPLNWRNKINQWFIQSNLSDDLRIKAQQKLQETDEGCEPCRTQLRAYLRQTFESPISRWQAQALLNESSAP
jgi:hypothetical protein